MSENASASGKSRRLRDQEKAREAAMNKATPSTPPQDPTPSQPAETSKPTEPTPAVSSTPDPGPSTDTDTNEDSQPALDVEYKSQYRLLSEKHRKLTAAHDTLKGKYNKAENEKKNLEAYIKQLENGDVKPSTDMVGSVRETEAYKRVSKEWDDETAEDFASMAAHMINQVQPAAPAQPAEPVEPDPVDPTDPSDDPFFLALDDRLPGWDYKYNDNPQFVTWIRSNFEPFSGESYEALLKRAHEASDVEAALRIFSAFDRSQVNQTTDPSPDSYIEPSNSGGAGTTQPEAPTFEANYLQEQETLLRRNKISRDEFYKRRNEFIKANNEGRVKAAA